MPISIISQKVYIKPEHLSHDVEVKILNKLKFSLEDKCTKQYGYIISVNRLVSISDNIISNTSGNIIFEVQCEIEYLKPIIGEHYEAKVIMIFQDGVVVKVQDRFTVFIRSNNMNEYEFDKIAGSYKKGKKEIQVDDDINMEIINIRYEKQNYDGIGKLI